jgi:predicted AlkP superfamily phosphohydrolase/phosphomutase
MTPRQRDWRVLVFEINEISWELMRDWLEAGELPNFRRLRERGSWGRTWADEPGGRGGLLDPWVTWTTLYTGVPQTEHGVEFLEQPVETIRAKRLWEYVADADKRVGVYGSAGSWPPPPVRGFFVPGSFSRDSQTYPERLRPIQDLNLRYTRAHAPGTKPPGMKAMLLTGLRLLRLGLNARTVFTILRTLVEVKRHPDRDWKKVSLQPVVNFAFFRKLYRRERPDFATFHTNHVAHYQHRFMRAWKPEEYLDPTAPEEITRFRDAIRYGYVVADRLLGKLMRLCDHEKNVVLCVASSMGQKPYAPAKEGQVVASTCRIKSIEQLVDLLNLRGRCEFFSTMAPQWNLRVADEGLRQETIRHLHAARFLPAGKTMYHADVVKDCMVVTPLSRPDVGPGTVCSFPTLPGAPTFPFEQLFVQADDTRKSGCHDPLGMFAFYGGPSVPGKDVGQVNNMDLAPTFLTLLGIPVPAVMKGHAISEAFREVATPGLLAPVS